MANDDLKRAFNALNNKKPLYDKLWDYYYGKAPLVYTKERLREIFENLNTHFSENWASVVVNTACDRINLQGFQGDNSSQELLDDIYRQNEFNLMADDVHEAALVCGESFIIAWKDENEGAHAYFNDPRMCHVFYDDSNPRKMSFAAKWYDTIDEMRRLTLYYPDHLEYYETKNKGSDVSSATAFVPRNPPSEENPFGQIPVFHFKPRRIVISDLNDIIPLQDGINKLLADMMVAAEYGAFRQRWVISNADVSNLKNAPNEVWEIPAGDGEGQAVSVGEFSSTDLSNYFNAVDKLATAVGIISRTPKHYLFAQSGDPSGEALIALEAPLNRKCNDYIARFKPTWEKLAAFMVNISGKSIAANSISAIFEKAETVQPRTEAEIRQMAVSAGIPLATILRREGWSEDEIKQMQKDADEAASKQKASLASALVQAQREMDQGGNDAGQGMQ